MGWSLGLRGLGEGATERRSDGAMGRMMKNTKVNHFAKSHS